MDLNHPALVSAAILKPAQRGMDKGKAGSPLAGFNVVFRAGFVGSDTRLLCPWFIQYG